MATWATHLMITDIVLEKVPQLDRRGFCVGSIAPDCNIENEDWTAFDPPREVTHFMGRGRKTAADSEKFFEERVRPRMDHMELDEELSFLLGYYAHLIADAEFQRMIRDEARVAAMWRRIRADEVLSIKAQGMEETWDAAKKLFPKADRFREREVIEAEYLQAHPESGYITEILALKSFPDYLDFLPAGAVVRKIGVMGELPCKEENSHEPFCITREEYMAYVEKAADMVVWELRKKGF